LYGKLSRLDKRQIKTGARVAQDDYSKENAQDFALWKAAKPEDEQTGAAWDSPWGRGRPGWHLECSAMAMDELGETLDIHCGGIDLIFPHHEDEIAQSEGASGKTFSRFWCHGAFLLTEGSKMAKRVGNVWTVDDLRSEKVSQYALRHFVFSTHYRKELNLVREAIDASAVATRKLGLFRKRLASATHASADLGETTERAVADFSAALLDDLSAPEALGAVFTFVHGANAALDTGSPNPDALKRARQAFDLFDSVLGVADPAGAEVAATYEFDLAGAETGAPASPGAPRATLTFNPDELGNSDRDWLRGRLASRAAARKNRDFATSDAVRDELAGRGYMVEDSPSGQVVKKA
jgi:cysteinyl-tRNA synthetase